MQACDILLPSGRHCRKTELLSDEYLRLFWNDVCVDFLHLLVKQNISNEIQPKPHLFMCYLVVFLSQLIFSVFDENTHSFILSLQCITAWARFSCLGCLETCFTCLNDTITFQDISALSFIHSFMQQTLSTTHCSEMKHQKSLSIWSLYFNGHK